MQFQRKFHTILIPVILLALLGSGCGSLDLQSTPIVESEPADDFVAVASATGVVVPVQWTTLSINTTGVIAEILVNEDELVSAGQVLLRLEGKENLQATMAANRLEITKAQQAYDSLFEEPDLRVARALEAVVDARVAVDDAQRRLNNLKADSPRPDIDQARANLVLAKDKLDKAKDDFEPYQNKPEDNLLRATLLSKMAQAQKDYDAAERKLNNLLGSANDLDIAEAEADLELAQAQLEKADRDYQMFLKGPDPDEVSLAEERLDNAETQLAAAEAALGDLELRAPFAGTVSEVYVRLSEWVSTGQPVLLLANLGELRIETTDLSEIDVAQIEVGDAATIAFDALPDVIVSGRVVRIATKAATGSGVNYPVVLELDEVPRQLRWGMTAFVDIEIK